MTKSPPAHEQPKAVRAGSRRIWLLLRLVGARRDRLRRVACPSAGADDPGECRVAAPVCSRLLVERCPTSRLKELLADLSRTETPCDPCRALAAPRSPRNGEGSTTRSPRSTGLPAPTPMPQPSARPGDCSSSLEIAPGPPRRPCFRPWPRTALCRMRGAGLSICMPSRGDGMI